MRTTSRIADRNFLAGRDNEWRDHEWRDNEWRDHEWRGRAGRTV